MTSAHYGRQNTEMLSAYFITGSRRRVRSISFRPRMPARQLRADDCFCLADSGAFCRRGFDYFAAICWLDFDYAASTYEAAQANIRPSRPRLGSCQMPDTFTAPRDTRCRCESTAPAFIFAASSSPRSAIHDAS